MSGASNEIETLRAEIAELRARIEDAPAPRKDIWDRLSAIGTLSPPFVLGVVGLVATSLYNSRQLDEQHLQAARDAAQKVEQQASQDRLSKEQVLEKLVGYVTNKEPTERFFGYAMFSAFGQDRLAVRLIDLQDDSLAGSDIVRGLADSSDQSLRDAAGAVARRFELSREIRLLYPVVEESSYGYFKVWSAGPAYGITAGLPKRLRPFAELLWDYMRTPGAELAGEIKALHEKMVADLRAKPQAQGTGPFVDPFDLTGREYLNRVDPDTRGQLRRLLVSAATDPAMRRLQDRLLDTSVAHLTRLMAPLNLSTPMGIAIVMHWINWAGKTPPDGPIAQTNEAMGGSPANKAVDERLWVKAFVGKLKDVPFYKQHPDRYDWYTKLLATDDWALLDKLKLNAEPSMQE